MNNIFSKSLLRYLPSLRLSVACLVLFNGLKSVVTKRVKPTALLCAINSLSITSYFKEKIFQSFITTKPTDQRTGVGLSLSYDIVMTLGGELGVDSRRPKPLASDETKEGDGSKFIVRLPA